MLFPGSAFLDLAAAAGRTMSASTDTSSAVSLVDVSIAKPLRLSDYAASDVLATVLQCAVTLAQSGVEITSVLPNTRLPAVHVKATLCCITAAATKPAPVQMQGAPSRVRRTYTRHTV